MGRGHRLWIQLQAVIVRGRFRLVPYQVQNNVRLSRVEFRPFHRLGDGNVNHKIVWSVPRLGLNHVRSQLRLKSKRLSGSFPFFVKW